MNRLSKFPLFGQFSRNIHVTRSLRDIPSDPVKELTDFCCKYQYECNVAFCRINCNVQKLSLLFTAEKHAKPLLPIINFMLWVVIPLCSIKLWYDEYQHKVVHRQRMPWPKHDWLNSQQRVSSWRISSVKCFKSCETREKPIYFFVSAFPMGRWRTISFIPSVLELHKKRLCNR